MSMKDAILDLVYDHGEVTFALLDQRIPGFEDTTAEGGCITFPGNDNCVLWAGVSVDAVNALKQLLAAGLIKIRAIDPWSYLSRNEGLDLPVATRPPAEGYDEPTWLPVCVEASVKWEDRLAS